MAPLPTVGGDTNTWGTVLNDYLGSLEYASYVIYKTGTDFAATSPMGLADVAADADAAAVMQSCLDNINSSTTPRGTIVFAPNTTFTWSTTPLIRRTYASAGSDDKKWLRILGSGGSVIQFAAAGECLLGHNRVADYDGFCGIEIGNLDIDANSETGDAQVIFGTRHDGASVSQRTDWRRIWIHDVRAYNVLAGANASANFRAGVWLQPSHIGSDSETVVEDVVIERVRIDGGNCGIAILGNGGNGSIRGDRIVIRDIYWDSGQNPYTTSLQVSSGIQVGGTLSGESLLIERATLSGSADNGIETNNMRTITVRDCVTKKMSTVGYFVNNFQPVIAGDTTQQHTQVVTYENCLHIRDYDFATGSNRAFEFFPNGNSIGTIIQRRCRSVDTVVQTFVDGPCTYVPSGAAHFIGRHIMEDCEFEVWTGSGASSTNCYPLWFYNTAKRTQIRNLKVTVRGADDASGGVLFVHGIRLGSTDGHIEIDGYEFVDQTTGRSSDTTMMVEMGSDTADGTNVIAAVFRGFRYRIEGSGGDAGPRGVQVGNATNLTLRKLIIDTADFSGLSGDSGIVRYATGTDNASAVFVRNFLERTRPPAEITFTPGATTVAAQYLGNYSGLMTVTGGTVTVVEVSTDGSTFRQVAAGTNCSFSIDNGQYVRMTYSSAPTCRVIPNR